MAENVLRDDRTKIIDKTQFHARQARTERISQGPLAPHIKATGQKKRRCDLLKRVRELSLLICETTDDADKDCQRSASLVDQLVAGVDELVTGGLPPSNLELREALIPIIGRLAEFPRSPSGFQLVLREVGRSREIRLAEPKAAKQPAPAVEAVAKLLGGRSIVLIGGRRRRESEQSLRDAFELQDLIWIATREHESVAHFEPQIARPDVVLVVLLIKLSSHSFRDVGKFCGAYAKPLVRLPRGYNKNQVAAEIMAQCSKRLTSTAYNSSVANAQARGVDQ